jgi:hypothetical protein
MKFLVFILSFVFLLAGKECFCQSDAIQQKYITVHFLYGSKPASGFRSTEKKMFGGIHGGHVSLQIDSSIFSFTPKYGWHIFPRHRKIEGGFILETISSFIADSVGNKYTSIQIPVSDSQYAVLKNFETCSLAKSPYDYAFFGMRCAAGAADVLSQIGILKKRSHFGFIVKDFYPKRLRRKLFRYAEKNKLVVVRKQGRKSRKWERD